jgi:hypothetical protein
MITPFARSTAEQPSLYSAAGYSPSMKRSDSACEGVQNFAPKRKAWSWAR